MFTHYPYEQNAPLAQHELQAGFPKGELYGRSSFSGTDVDDTYSTSSSRNPSKLSNLSNVSASDDQHPMMRGAKPAGTADDEDGSLSPTKVRVGNVHHRPSKLFTANELASGRSSHIGFDVAATTTLNQKNVDEDSLRQIYKNGPSMVMYSPR